jgi:hypothetical protein
MNPVRPPRKSKTHPAVQAAWITGVFGLAAVFLTFMLTGRDQPIKMPEMSGGKEVPETSVTPPSQSVGDVNPPKEKPAVEPPTLTGGNPGNPTNTEEPNPTAPPGPSTTRELPGNPSDTPDPDRSTTALRVPGPARISISADTTGAIYGDYRGKIPIRGVPELANGTQVQVLGIRSRRAEITWTANGNLGTGWVDTNILRPLLSKTP